MMNLYIITALLSGLKSSKLTNLEGVAHNVLLIFISLTLSILYLTSFEIVILYFVIELLRKLLHTNKDLYKLVDI